MSMGMHLEIVGPLAGGEVGATEVRDRDGRRLVLKRWPGGDEEGAALGAGIALVEKLRGAGYPAPRYLVAGSFDGELVAMQIWVDGDQREDLSEAMVERLVALALRHGEVRVPANGEFWAWLTSSLLEGCDGYCLHEPLRTHSGATRSMLDRIHAIGARTAGRLEPATGVVHRDFHHRNVLWQGDDVTAVIDWEGAGAGDPMFDLVTLAFGLTVATGPPPARELPWRAVAYSRPAGVLQAYAAHMALRQVDWSIRHRTPQDVEHWLRVGRDALDRFEGGAELRSPA
jgi:Ser/Thr protein kinase RdoA (MazF antagonist)